MKSYFIVLLLLLGLKVGHSQIEYGIKFGVNSSNITIKQLLTDQSTAADQFFQKENLGYQAGLFLRFKLLGLYAEPNLFYHRSNLTLEMTNEENGSEISQRYKLSAYTLPLQIGVKLSVLRLFAGPVVSLEKYQVKNALDNYKEDLSKSNFGLQTGIGLDIKKIKLEAIYENVSFSTLTDISEMAAENLEFKRSSRISINLGFKF